MTRRFTGDTLIIATHNEGKREEMAVLLEPLGVACRSAAELGLAVPEETETTFAGNARLKAHAAARATGLPALADDSGLTVDALGGAPGVHTADWAETVTGRDFEMAMKRVWSELTAAAAAEPRLAQFRCTLALAWPDGEDAVFEGIAKGRIVWPMKGNHGHGFDPIFQPEGSELTFGEMDRWQKNAVSHRADAFAKLIAGCFT